MNPIDKPLVWLHGSSKTPPFSPAAHLEAGFLLRRLQRGESLSLPYSRSMLSTGPLCHELRINDRQPTWRIIYRIDEEAIVLLEVYAKQTNQTPILMIETCHRRLRDYDSE